MIILSPDDRDVAVNYGACHLMLWPDFPLKHWDFLRSLPVHNTISQKKMKSKHALEPVKNIRKHALGVWTHDLLEAFEIQEIMRETQYEIRDWVVRWFGSNLGDEMHTWRYTVTENEPPHFDKYSENITNTVIRVFVNFDVIPRVWDIGTTEPNGPYTRFEFQPGSFWLVDSKQVEHAIIFGRRAGMFSFELH